MTGLWSGTIPSLDAPVLRVADVLQMKGLDMTVAKGDVGQIRAVTVHRVDVVNGNGRIVQNSLDQLVVHRVGAVGKRPATGIVRPDHIAR